MDLLEEPTKITHFPYKIPRRHHLSWLPSGKRLHSSGKSPSLMATSTISGHFQLLCNKLPESKSQGFPRAIGKNPPDRISKRGADGAPRPEDGAADVALRDHGHLCET